MSDSKIFGASMTGWVAPDLPGPPVMQGRYARLEILDAKTHAEELFSANQLSDAIWDYLAYGPFQTQSDYADWVRSMAHKSDPFFYAVRDMASGKALGIMSYLRVEHQAGSIEVGHINWSVPLQKTPSATEALFLMMGWAFEAGYRRFEWKCNAMNSGSRRAAERFGFSYEGVFRQHMITKGRNRDTAWFACIDREWPALKAAYETWLDPENFDANGVQKQSLSKLTRAIRVADDPSLAE